MATSRRRTYAVATAGVAAAGVAGVVWGAGLLGPATEPGVRLAPPAIEEHSSETARDWVQGADVVLRVEAGSEVAGAELDGSGDVIPPRTITLDVVDVVWTARPSGPAPPGQLTLRVSGWVTTDGEKRLLAVTDTPRVEPGETYLVAFLNADPCRPGAPDAWAFLGSQAILAYEDGVIGRGESSGQRVDGDPSQAAPGSFERTMLGKSSADLARALDQQARNSPPPTPATPSC